MFVFKYEMFIFKYERERREKDLNVLGAEQEKRKLKEGRGAEDEESRGEVGREHSSTCAV